jgi:GT2 family glycosyltransferase
MKIIDIVILHFGDIEVTKKCIQSLEKYLTSYRRIILINNDVRYDITKIFKQTKKRICINSGANLGFAKGVNIGIKKALEDKADYVVLLNNDTSSNNDFLLPLVEVLERNKQIGIAGPVIKFRAADTFLFDHGGELSPYTGSSNHDNRKKPAKDEVLLVDFISGCCMMIKADLLKTIGLFDENYFMYYEDVDFCLRAKKSNFSIAVVPVSIINHALSKSVGRNSPTLIYHLTKSRKRFISVYSKFPLRHIAFYLQSMKFFLKDPAKISVITKALLNR